MVAGWMDGRPFPAPYQHSKNNDYSFCTEESHTIHTALLWNTPVPDNQALAIDALSANWNNLHACAFPPTILIPSFLIKIHQFQCRAVLIAPLWPQHLWFLEVLQLLVSAPIGPPYFPNLPQTKCKFQHQNPSTLALHAWEFS